jgi:ankyrin repeat protein
MGWTVGVETLLDHGASALSRTPAQDMGMHWAAYRGDVDILQQLINAGGDVNSMGDVGNRPIHLAASADHLEVRMALGPLNAIPS